MFEGEGGGWMMPLALVTVAVGEIYIYIYIYIYIFSGQLKRRTLHPYPTSRTPLFFCFPTREACGKVHASS